MSAQQKRNFGGIVAGLFLLAAVIFSAVWPPSPGRAQLGGVQTWAGTSTGAVNTPSIAINNVSALGDLLGVPLRFVPNNINTGASTLTIRLDSGGTLSANIYKPSSGTGIVALTGGELQTSQIANVTYDGTQFQCTTCGSPVLPGTEADYNGITIPAGWLKSDGSAISRTTYVGLFNALTLSTSATTTNTVTSVVVPSSAAYQVGWYVGGTNVTCNSTITAIPDGTHITISIAASGSGATTLTLGPYQQGDCSTTFNLPNHVGRSTAMVDGSTNITSTTCTNAGSLGANCGAQTQTLTLAQLPTGITSTGAVTPNGGRNVASTAGAINSYQPGNGGTAQSAVAGTGAGGSGDWGAAGFSGTFTSNNTSGSAHPILHPIAMVYKIVKT